MMDTCPLWRVPLGSVAGGIGRSLGNHIGRVGLGSTPSSTTVRAFPVDRFQPYADGRPAKPVTLGRVRTKRAGDIVWGRKGRKQVRHLANWHANCLKMCWLSRYLTVPISRLNVAGCKRWIYLALMLGRPNGAMIL